MFVLLLPGNKKELAKLNSIHLTMDDIVKHVEERDLLWIKARPYNAETDRGKTGQYVPLGRHMALINHGWIMCE